MSRTAWRILQGVAVAAVLVFVGLQVSDQWTEIRAIPGTIDIDWRFMVWSALVVVASYAVLIWTWLHTVRAWGERLSYADGARIWLISNLGRYLPGKVWQIGAMGVLAQQAGVSPSAAVGSSLVVSIVNVLAGIVVAFAAGAGNLGAPAWAMPLTLAAGAVALATPWLLPRVARFASMMLRREIRAPHIPVSTVWIAAAGCGIAWILYGIAFRFLHIAVLGEETGDLMRSTAVFTTSYIAGFLFLPAPGGIGVREAMLHRLLGDLGIAAGAHAWLVVFASRIWLTVIEVLPGLLLLLIKPRPAQPSSSQVV